MKRDTKGCKPWSKAVANKTTIRSTLEYASVVWDLYTAANRASLEKVQRRVRPTRFITGNYHDYAAPDAVPRMLEDLHF